VGGSGGIRRTLTGPEKVGLLLLALGSDRANALLRKFDAEELNAIMRSTDAMPTISTPELTDIVEEFKDRIQQGLPFVGNGEEVRRLVSAAIVESRSTSSLAGAADERPNVWARLTSLSDDLLLGYFSSLHPQIVTYLLNRLNSEKSSTILRLLPPQIRNDVVSRMVGLKDVQPAIVESLEQSIEQELFALDNPSSKYVTLAGIINNFEKAESTETLDYLSSIRPKDAEAIRKLLFKFEDLIRLPPKALTALMDGVPVERTVIALQGMEPEFQQKVLIALSPRARRMAEAELLSGARASPRDLAESRRTIVDAVLKLMAEGIVEFPTEAAA